MIETISMAQGVTLRCFTGEHFKQGCISIQYLRPMCKEEAALNALLPSILLSGTAYDTDLRAISIRLADLYGTSVIPLVRRTGNIQSTGLYCSFIEEHYAMSGDRIFAPVLEFVCQVLLEPYLQSGVFSAEYTENEKANQISSVQAQLNDKRAYAQQQLLINMCGEDSFAIPTMGTVEQISQIMPQSAYAHYRRILAESPIEIFYMGKQSPREVARLLQPLLSCRSGNLIPLPRQEAFSGGDFSESFQAMHITQGKLCMGFTTPTTICDEKYPAMYVFSTLFGSGMTNKLFTHIREEMSLCYDIGAYYVANKGIFVVSAGADFGNCEKVRQQVLCQLEACCAGDIREEELDCAKQSILSGLCGVSDTPAGIERFYTNQALSGTAYTPELLSEKVAAVTMPQVIDAAKSLTLRTVFSLKGDS